MHIGHGFVIPSERGRAKEVMDDILAFAQEFGLPDCEARRVRLALEEVLTNALEHGNKNDPKKTVGISYAMEVGKEQSELLISIEDDGEGIDADIPPGSEEGKQDRGRGLRLMHGCMTKVVNIGPRVQMWKTFVPETPKGTTPAPEDAPASPASPAGSDADDQTTSGPQSEPSQ